MIDRGHALPVSKQCAALGISRGSIYYEASHMLGDLAGAAVLIHLIMKFLFLDKLLSRLGVILCSVGKPWRETWRHVVHTMCNHSNGGVP